MVSLLEDDCHLNNDYDMVTKKNTQTGNLSVSRAVCYRLEHNNNLTITLRKNKINFFVRYYG